MPQSRRAETRAIAFNELLAVFVGQDAAHIAAVEFALTESGRGHYDCAREALRGVPTSHLQRAISGAAVLSRLAADLLVGPTAAPASDPTGDRQ